MIETRVTQPTVWHYRTMKKSMLDYLLSTFCSVMATRRSVIAIRKHANIALQCVRCSSSVIGISRGLNQAHVVYIN